MCERTQELFLLEFLVDRLNIPSVQARQKEVLPVSTCIEFKILNLPPVYVSQEASGESENCSCLGEESQSFRKGKSCLFGLAASLLQKPVCAFPVLVTVYKKLPPSVLPDVMLIGSCEIETRDMLNCLLEEDEAAATCPSRALRSKFRISTATGQCVGELGLFLRFSRLGRRLVTQFQSPRERKPFLFRGSGSCPPVFQCRRVPSRLPAEDPPDTDATRPPLSPVIPRRSASQSRRCGCHAGLAE